MLPTLDQVRDIAASGDYRRIPVKRELFADRFTVIEMMRALRAESSHCFLLESAEADRQWGRYSFLGFKPTAEITCIEGQVRIRRDVEGAQPSIEFHHTDHPGQIVRQMIADNHSPRLKGFPPFCGGLVGYFSYDYITYAEPILRDTSLDRGDFLDVDLMLFDKVIVFDAFRQKVMLIAGVSTDDLEASYVKAGRDLDDIERILTQGDRESFLPLELRQDLKPNFSRKRYCDMVEVAKDHIREGDIFQVVLSNPLTAPATGNLFDTYRVLRCENPSPYMFYFTSDDVEIAGASPETLVRLEDGRLYTYPLAGTRPRGATPEQDRALEHELIDDEKELAEHNMLVDLGRNDLGRVSELGSIHVETYLSVLRFSRVMHIGSTIVGRIAPGKDAVDVIDAVLPAGTLSGAPKVRACQIIRDLEGVKRGIYGGAIGYIDFSGNLDTGIGIRLAYKKNGMVCVQSGAGIVAESVPQTEYEECRNKARAVVDAIHQAQGGLA